MELKDRIERVLVDHQQYHDELQMESFIVGKQGTVYGMYRQTLRELHSRYNTIRQRLIAVARAENHIEKLKVEEAKAEHPELIVLKRVEKEMFIEEQLRSLKDLKRELGHFLSKAETLKEQIGELTDEKRRQLSHEFWTHELKTRLAISLLREGKPSVPLLEMMPALPGPVKDEIVEAVKRPQAILQWYYNLAYELPETPELEIDEGDMKKLLETTECQYLEG